MHPYSSAAYAAAFAPLKAEWLAHANTHALLRPIAGTSAVDSMGCYPVCVFEPSDRIDDDFATLASKGAVSLVLVTDCLTQPSREFLEAHFDHLREYKTHFLFDGALGGQPSKHHRDAIRRANRACTARVVQLAEHLDAWCACYDTLTRRMGLAGIHAFSRAHFEQLSVMPELVTIGAFTSGELVSAHLFLRHEGKVYSHLAASTPRGYQLEAAFSIYDAALQRFGRDHVIDFGGGAGLSDDVGDGLARFKRGFANSERRNFLCGKILDRDAFARLCGDREMGAFFPPYRAPPSAPSKAGPPLG